MPRLSNLLRSGHSSARSSTQSLTALEEHQRLDEAMKATGFVIDDDLLTAERLLGANDDAFHKLGRATVSFVRSVLGMERDIMEEATVLLSDAESAALIERNRTQHDPGSFRSSIYAPGTEYDFCIAQAQVMSAIIAVLSESITEAVKGFYRVRKAYLTLERIMQMEETYLSGKVGATGEIPITPSHVVRNVKPSRIQGNINFGETIATHIDLVDDESDSDKEVFVDASEEPLKDDLLTGDGGAEVLSATHLTNTIDTFIHSGASLYSGMLQLLLSLIPPSFTKLLSIIGFRGDRGRGLSLLWRAAAFNNINGTVASLTLLGYFTGLVSLLDTLPSSGPNSFPQERCDRLLAALRVQHPRSVLCLMQDVRMMTANRELVRAVKFADDTEPSALKQIAALQCFENSLNYMYLHRYEQCAEGFLKCIDLNNWSKALYYYIAGCAHVELYRLYKYGCSSSTLQSRLNIVCDATKAAYHAKSATLHLEKVPVHAGKKRIFARQLPFDVFVSRKLAKWTARASAWGVDLIDAVGVSPLEEMIFFWGGYGRMADAELQDSLSILAWNDGAILASSEQLDVGGGSSNPYWSRETVDEHAALSVLRATCHRRLGANAISKQILKDQVIDRYKWEELKSIKDGERWPAPIARYEMAVCWWLESEEGRKVDLEGATTAAMVDQGNCQRLANGDILKECSKWLELVAKWEPYDLDVRFGTKITTGKETLKKLGFP